MTKDAGLTEDSTLGKEIANAYRWINELERKHGVYPRNVALQIVNRCKAIANQLPDEMDIQRGHLNDEIKELEDEMHGSRGTFNSATTNLGVRIQLHLICRDHNLFGRQTGWIFEALGEDEGDHRKMKQHYLIKNVTVCGHEAHPKSEPSNGIHDIEYAPLCIACTKEFLKERFKEPPKGDPYYHGDGTTTSGGFNAQYKDGKVESVWVQENSHYEEDTANPGKHKRFEIKRDIYGNILEKKEVRDV